MRSTIERQFLLPVLAVAVLCFVASSLAAVYVTTRWVRAREREHLTSVVEAITAAGFPLSNNVLERMSGLSGAQFVVVDAQGAVVAGDATLDSAARERIAAMPLSKHDELWTQPALELAGRSYLAARLPLVTQSSPARPLSMIVLYPEDRWWAARRQIAATPLIVGAVGLVVLASAVALVARRVVSPLIRLRQSTLAISQGDFSTIPVPQRDDEIRDLTTAINDMAERLSRFETQVRQNERLRTLGQLSGGLAHQLRNSATGARMALDLHARSCHGGADDECLNVALRQLTLIESFIQRLLTLGERRQPSFHAVPLAQLVSDIVSLVRPTCRHAHIDLNLSESADRVVVSADAMALEQVVLNLLFNAIEAVQQNGDRPRAIHVRVERDAARQGLLSVDDTGPGPADDIQSRLFEPFATDKPDGTGLGLAVARQIVAEHQGRISWRRLADRTRFEVELPLAEVN